MLGISSSLVKGGASLLTYVKDNLKLYLDFKSNKSDTLKFPSEGSTEFDGSDDNIAISHSSDLSFGTNPHTISAWAKIDALANYKTIISKRQAGGTVTDYNLSVGANGVVYTYNGSAVAQTATGVISTGSWFHYALVYDGSAYQLYIDGSAVAWASGTTTSGASNSHDVAIGWDRTGNYWDGKIANVALWSRELTPEEVQSIMNKSYSQLKGVEKTSLVSWLGLDNSTDRGTDFWNVGVFTQEGSPTTSTYSNGLLNVVGNGNNTGARFSFPSTGSTSIEGYNQYEFSFDIKITSGAGSGVKIQYHYSNAISSTFNDVIDTTEAPNQEFKRFVTTLYSDNSYSSNRYFVLVQNGSTVAEFQVKNIVLKPITANDSEGSNHGQLVQETTTTTSVYGVNAPILPRAVDVAKEGQADAIGDGSASFVGSNTDAIVIQNGKSPSYPFTLTAWVYPELFNSYGAIYNAWVNDSLWWGIYSHSSNGLVRLHLVGGNDYIDTPSGSLPVNEWSHIATTWDGTNAKTYINGIAQTMSLTGTLAMPTAEGPPSIGVRSDNLSHNPYTGDIAQLGIFAGVLTQAQVQSVMESTSYSKIPADVKSTLGADELPSPDLTSGTGLTITQGTTGTLTHDTTAGTITATDDVQDGYLRWYSASLEENKLYKLEIVVDSYTGGRFRTTLGWNGTNFYPSVGTNIQYFVGSSTASFGIRIDDGNPAEFVISKISVKEVTNDIVAYYPLDGSSSRGNGTDDVTTGEVLGNEMVNDTDFTGDGATDNPWRTTQAGWNYNTTENRIEYNDINNGHGAYQFDSQMANSFVAGQLYRAKFTIGGLSSGVAKFTVYDSGLVTTYVDGETTGYGNGTHYAYFVTPSSNISGLVIYGKTTSTSSWYMTEFSIKEVTSNTGVLK